MNRFYKIILKNLIWVPFILPRMRLMAKHPERYTEEQRYALAMKVVQLVADSGSIQVRSHGMEHIPSEGGCLICPNHQDKFDPLAIWLTHKSPVSVVIDDAACHRPVICDFVPMVDGIKLLKNDLKGMYRATEEVRRKLQQDKRYILFPEGQYEEEYHTLRPFMTGCFRSAMKANKPILPVAIVDSFRAFAYNEPAPVLVDVHYLPPILPADYAGLNTSDVSEMVRTRIQEALDRFQN